MHVGTNTKQTKRTAHVIHGLFFLKKGVLFMKELDVYEKSIVKGRMERQFVQLMKEKGVDVTVSMTCWIDSNHLDIWTNEMGRVVYNSMSNTYIRMDSYDGWDLNIRER